MPARRGEACAGRLRPLVLDNPGPEIGERPDQPGHGVRTPPANGGDDDEHEQWHRERRVDHGDVVPSHPVVRERPEQLRAVRGAGIEKPVRRVAEEARQVGLANGERAAHHPVQQQRRDRPRRRG